MDFPQINVSLSSLIELALVILNPVFKYTRVLVEHSLFNMEFLLFNELWDFLFSLSDLTLVEESLRL